MATLTGNPSSETERLFRVLCLDGGGSKGVYSLGVLQALESQVGRPLGEVIDLIYGVSTGAVIATFLALGLRVEEIHEKYRRFVPLVMRHNSSRGRSQALQRLADEELARFEVSQLRTKLGIVALNRTMARPFVFKSSVDMAYSSKETFIPFFGVPLSRAVAASCAAYPLFDPVTVTTSLGDSFELVDGGYVANNPSLLAISDTRGPLGRATETIRLLSVGVGRFPAKEFPLLTKLRLVFWRNPAKLLEQMMDSSSHTIEFFRTSLFSNVRTVRIDQTYSETLYATNLLDARNESLDRMFCLGRAAFHEREGDVAEFFR